MTDYRQQCQELADLLQQAAAAIQALAMAHEQALVEVILVSIHSAVKRARMDGVDIDAIHKVKA